MNVLRLLGRVGCVVFMLSCGFTAVKGILLTTVILANHSPNLYLLSPALAQVGVGIGGLAILVWAFRKLKPVSSNNGAQSR